MVRASDVYAQSNTSPQLSAIPVPTRHNIQSDAGHSQESASTFISPGNLRFTERILYITEMSTRSRKIKFLGSRARLVCRIDNLTTICGLIV
jgi:hypothetical protein